MFLHRIENFSSSREKSVGEHKSHKRRGRRANTMFGSAAIEHFRNICPTLYTTFTILRINYIHTLQSTLKTFIFCCRFLPSVAVVVGFYATWLRHIPFGPMGIGVCEESERCRQNWWTNILFIQNHVNRYYMVCNINNEALFV